MATLTYDPSDDPQAIEAAEARDAESLAVGEELEQQQNELLAGKYKSAEELEQAYIELQKKLGSPEQEQPEAPQETEEVEEVDPIAQAFETADVEFSSNGELSAETLGKLSEMSSEDLIKAYLDYQSKLGPVDEAPQGVELSDQDVSEIHNSVGGAEKYQQLVQWAAQNFSEQEIQAFDNVVESGNKNAINFALQALKSRYTDAVGFEGEMLQGKAAASQDVFRSQAELVRAMNDPRYDKDPAYRQDIYDKLDRSNISF
jgi:hypothetical protein